MKKIFTKKSEKTPADIHLEDLATIGFPYREPLTTYLDPGIYSSRIDDVQIFEDEDYDTLAFKFFHTLENCGNEVYRVIFTYYDLHFDTEDLAKKFLDYGLSGTLEDVIGLEEYIKLETWNDFNIEISDRCFKGEQTFPEILFPSKS